MTQSADDALEPDHDELQVGQQGLPQDYSTPAASAQDTSSSQDIPNDHPATDAEVDEHELYDEGLTSATDIDAHHETNERRDSTSSDET